MVLGRSRARRRPAVLAVVLVLAIGGAGVGALVATRSSEPSGVELPDGDFVPRSEIRPEPAGPEEQGEPAPDFTVRTLDGTTVTMADLRGRPAVLFFMAYWCSTCIPEARALGRIHVEFDDVAILGVDIDPSSSPDALREFISVAGDPAYPFGFDDGGATARAFGVRSLDTTIVIDRQGRIVYRDGWPTDYETLRREVGRVA